MTAQEVIKKFMASLDIQNYNSATTALDDAVRKSSRYNGIQAALDSFLADQQKVEREAIKTVLTADGNYKEEYDGLQLSELLEMADTDTDLAAALEVTAKYSDNPLNYANRNFTATQRIRMTTAETFLKDYCGIELELYLIPVGDDSVTYYSAASTGNLDTGAITGSDAGGDTVKTSHTVVPEIGNKYTATSSAPQNISTGSNDWIVQATDFDDTITSGGADSIDAGAGADSVYVTGDYATIKTGESDLSADTVTVSSNVKVVTISDFDEFDTINIEGDFSVESATLTSDTVTITDSTGERTLIIDGWTSAKDGYISINNQSLKIGNWLSDFIDYEETESTNTAVTSTSTDTAITVNLENVTDVGGGFNLSATSNEAIYDSDTGDVGTVTTAFPDVTSFTTRGLTVELWGTATNSEATTVTALTLDRMTTAQKTVWSGVYKWWIKEGLKLNEESFGLGFTNDGVTGANIKVFFYNENSTSLAFVRNHGSGKDLELGINMTRFSSIAEDNVDGSALVGTSTTLNLDRTLAHELTHAVMAANVNNFNSLPQFVTEGLAELVHGIDDERVDRLWYLAGGTTDTSRLSSALDLDDTGTGDNDAYAGGYMFFRYLAKQAAEDTTSGITLSEATVSVNLSGNNETYYANLTSASSIERAVTTASDSNYSVGTAQNHNYTVAAGITQQIYVGDNGDWKFTDIYANNSVIAGSGNDTVVLSSTEISDFVNLGNGDNRVSINGGTYNTITAGTGADSIRIEQGSYNSIQTGAGNDSVTFANYNNYPTVNPANYIDAGAGNDYVQFYGYFQTVNGGADNDTIFVRGDYASVDGGTGDDKIEIYAANNTISGGAGDDSIYAFSTGNIIDAGAGADEIQISATNNTVTGGAGEDAFIVESGVRHLYIEDFSVSDRDYLYLNYSVDYALYNSQSNAITLGNLNLYLDNLKQISDFFNMRIYLNENQTTLKSLLNADTFNWGNGEYYFLIDESTDVNILKIAAGELVYNKDNLQSGTDYAKVTINNNSISVESEVEFRLDITPSNTTAKTLTINNDSSYIFSGAAKLFNLPTSTPASTAYTGNYTVNSEDTLYFYDDSFKSVYYTGASSTSTVQITLGDTMAVYLNRNDTVAITNGTLTELYIADNSEVIKQNATATLNSDGDTISEDIYTYQGGTFTFGRNVLDVDFSTELNHYTADYQEKTIDFWSGTLKMEGLTFTLENQVSESGITLLYDSAGENLVGISADNFTEGESITIDSETYTVTNGKIIRSKDNLPYNGNWNEFIANKDLDYYWGSITGWTIDGGAAVYTVDGEEAIRISGLNLTGVEVVDGQIAELAMDSKTVNIDEKVIAANQITVNGAGYEFVFNKQANVKVTSAVTTITGSEANDIISAEGIEHKNDDFYVYAGAGADSVSVANVNQSGGTFNILGETDNDSVTVANVTVESGSSFNVNAGAGDDSVSVSSANIVEDGNLAVNAGAGNDFIAAICISNSTGFVGIYGDEGADTISVSSINASNDSEYFISGDTYAGTSSVSSNDLISVDKVTVAGGGVSVVGNLGNDTLSVSNVSVDSGTFVVEGDYSGSANTAGNDLISVTDATGVKIISGGGNDTLQFGGSVQATISDFSTNDIILLNDSVKSAIYRKSSNSLTFGNVQINLSGVEDIYTYSAMKVINGESETTLGDLIETGLSWEVTNGTAIYNEDVITVTGLSSTATPDDLALDSESSTVAISENALAQGNTVAISPRGYTLELASDVSIPTLQDPQWTVTRGTGKYNATTTGGYILSNNTIVYKAESVGADIITVNNLSTNATSDDLVTSSTTVIISEHALDTSKTVSTPDGYTLQLADDVPIPTVQDPAWTIDNRGNAKYNITTTAGYKVSNNQISYQAQIVSDDIIAFTGLKSTVTDTNLTVSGTSVIVSADALDQYKTVTMTGDGYTLKFDSDVTTPTVLAASWKVARGTANYNVTTTAGYIISDNQIKYQSELTGENLITVTNLNPATTDSSVIELSDTTVVLHADALLTNRNATLSLGDGYTLALGDDVTQPETSKPVWTVTKGTARYNTTTSAGYVVSGNTVVYRGAIVNSDLITITGLNTNATVANISLTDKTVKIYANALSQDKTVEITGEGYNLALGENVTKPITSDPAWNISNGTANYRTTTSAGYIITDSGTITYQAARTDDPIITVTGLTSKTTAEDLVVKGTTVTVSDNALSQDNTVEISEGYTLQLADDVTQPVTSKAGWEVSRGTAHYRTSTSAGYTISDGKISYQAAKIDDDIITVTGLHTRAVANDLSLKNTVVTLNSNALSQTNTVEISDGYTLALGRNVEKPITVKASWAVSEGSAHYRTTSTAGYVISNSGKISYQAARANDDIITVTGLSTKAATSDVSVKKTVVTVSSTSALSQDNTVEISDGYTLALGKNVTQPVLTEEGWSVKNGTGYYKTASQTAGYIISDNTIVYDEEITGETLITVTGLKSKANPKYISLNKTTNTVTLAASVVDKKNVTVTDGYALNFAKGTYTGASVTGGDDADTISASSSKLVINTSGGDDLITLASGTANNTIIAGSGDDSIKATKGKNIYQYAEGDGNDTINGFTENDTIKITSGEVDSWSINNANLILNIGEGSITLKDAVKNGVSQKINFADSKNNSTTQIYANEFIYNSGKTALTLASGFTGALDSTTYEAKVTTIDAAAAGAVSIKGNAQKNIIIGGKGADTLIGGKGNDTLTGGDGADIFVYGRNEGKDVIKDYEEEDTIYISNGSISGAEVSISKQSSDVLFTVGSGKLTVKDGAGKKITVKDSLGADSTNIYEKGKIYDEDKTAVKFTEKFSGTLESGIVVADGSAVKSKMTITGNSLNNSITGGKATDVLSGGAGNDTIYGGNGNDTYIYTEGDDVIADYEAGEKISLDAAINGFSVEENNVIFETDNGSITVLEGVGKQITTITKVGTNKKTDTLIYESGLIYNDKKTAVSLAPEYEGNYTPGTKVRTLATINGAAADSVSIKGNSQNNLIIGGAGNDTLYGGGNKNDTLTGGDGADVFIFGSGDGKDVITDYSDSDTIYIGSSSVASASISGSDILFTIGKGTLTVKDGVGQKINFQDSSGTTSTNIYEKGAIYDGDKTSVTFTSGLKVTLESSVVTADGSAVSDALKIVGNDLNNTIYGGSGKDTLYGGAGADFLSGGAGNDTLYGGAGNDTLTGGDGKNVFVYEGGNDTITDYAAGDKIKFTGTVNVSYSGNDVVFSTSKGSVTVTDGAGKNITTVVGSKTTTRLYSNSNARTADLFYDNNFISDDNNLDSITEQKFTVTQINTEEDKTFAQDKNILTFAKDK